MFRPNISKILLFRKTIAKIPMKISLPLIFTAPVIVVVIVLSTIAYLEANSAVNDLMAQNLVQIQDHIEERLDDLLNLPSRIQRVNANLIRQDHLNLKHLRSWRHTLFEQAQAFKGLSSITWGSADGRSVGIVNHPDKNGGDYYDFLKIAGLPDTTAAIVVGDVVGHGVAAAMLMATARGILLSRCRTPGSLADLLTHLNNQLVNDTGGERFMTMLLMALDADKKEMRWASAGHDTPLVYDPIDDRFHEFKGSNLSLGLMKKAEYEEHAFTDVKSGQIYMASTDGLWEAFNGDSEMFGKDRIRDLIRRCADLPAQEICEKINAELSDFLGDTSPDDDLTFVIVKIEK